jgi:hypothetical protein
MKDVFTSSPVCQTEMLSRVGAVALYTVLWTVVVKYRKLIVKTLKFKIGVLRRTIAQKQQISGDFI